VSNRLCFLNETASPFDVNILSSGSVFMLNKFTHREGMKKTDLLSILLGAVQFAVGVMAGEQQAKKIPRIDFLHLGTTPLRLVRPGVIAPPALKNCHRSMFRFLDSKINDALHV
jgi:hypothetical protein